MKHNLWTQQLLRTLSKETEMLAYFLRFQDQFPSLLVVPFKGMGRLECDSFPSVCQNVAPLFPSPPLKLNGQVCLSGGNEAQRNLLGVETEIAKARSRFEGCKLFERMMEECIFKVSPESCHCRSECRQQSQGMLGCGDHVRAL